jgi:hypothetical protein
MPLWRIRIRLSDDQHSRALLDEALAGQQVARVELTPRSADSGEMAGNVVLELPHDDDLGAMLTALHRISPQVFVSRVDEERPSARQPILTGPLRTSSRLVSADFSQAGD